MSAAFTFLAGLAGLLAAGHYVVAAASAIGRRFGLTPMVVGLTVVAAGTSAPELAVVGQSIGVGDTDLAIGSVMGSNIANVLLVLGLAAGFGTIRVSNRVVRVDIPVMIAATLLLFIVARDGLLDRPDGVIMVGALLAFVVWTVLATRASDAVPTLQKAVGRSGEPRGRSRPLLMSVVVLAAGIAGLAVAARFVVTGAEELALAFGVPELIIGLTVLAIGTSAPEIVTTVIAALQGNRDLAVGNAVGSNIFNILLVMGASTVFAPDGISITQDAIELDMPIMLVAAFACLPMVVFDNKLDRWEGALFVAFYIAYVIFLVLDGTGHRAKDPFVLVMLGFVAPLTIVTVGVITFRQLRRRRARPDQGDVAPRAQAMG